MKTLIPIFSLLLVSLAASSCRKNYKCTCRYSYVDSVTLQNTAHETTYVLYSKNKKDADSKCWSKSVTVGGDVGISCKLD